jgi:chemotaxis protein methyltransferase CheR
MASGTSRRPSTLRPRIRAGEFALLRDLIYREAGILLGRMKSAMLVSRLWRRLRALEMSSFQAYYECLMGDEHPDELQRMLDCVVTNETHFFREPRQFEFLEEQVFPDWRAAGDRGTRPKTIRAWSAACSTGQESYSLAMSLLWHFPADKGWTVEVLGTDLSTKVLRLAGEGIWSYDEAAKVPERYLERYMLRGTGEQKDRISAGPALRSVVRLGRLNLHAERYPPIGSFDLVLCRNVFIYFDEKSRQAALQRVIGRLSEGGYLLLGHAEWPEQAGDRLDRLVPGIYQRPPGRRGSLK